MTTDTIPQTELEELDRSTDKKKIWITEAIILASCPVLAYIISFTYELGFADTYGYPTGLIFPNYSTLFIAGLFSLSALCIPLIAYISGQLLAIFEPEQALSSHGKLWSAVCEGICFLLFLVIIWYGVHKDTSVTYNGFALYIVNSMCLVILFLCQPVTSFLIQLIRLRHQHSQTPIYNLTIIDKYRSYLTKILLVAFTIANLLCICYNAGKKQAESQTLFYTFSEGKMLYAVARIYNDTLICAAINPQTHQITGMYRVHKTDDHLTLTLRKVGPLSMPKDIDPSLYRRKPKKK